MQLGTGQIIDRYAIEGRLGQGGMAVVYLVRHQQLGSAHAMKVLTNTSPAVRDRLLGEGRAQSRLRHPNVVGVTDVVSAAGQPALVMELIEGPSLDRFLAKSPPLSLDQVDQLARGILRGVRAAHRQGLVHRDLKPGNVMLAVVDGQVVPKVADFGLAKSMVEAGSATRTGAAMGTPAYMAPEQIRDAKSVDGRADVFSLGAILYELVAGVRPFAGQDTFELFAAIVAGERVPIAERVPDLPPRMRHAIEGALTVEADERWPTVDALLEAWEDGAPSMAALLEEPAAEELVALVEQHSPEREGLSDIGLTPPSGEPVDAQTFALDGSMASVPDPGPPESLAGTTPVEEGPGSTPSLDLAVQRPWVVGLGAMVASAPFAYGLLAVLFGDPILPLRVGGPFMLAIVPLGMVASGAAVGLGVSERAGRDRGWWWVVLPMLVLLLGSVGTLLGATMVLRATARITGEMRALLSANGSLVAMVTEMTGLALGSMALLVSCIALVWAHRPASAVGISQRGATMLGTAFVGGTALWLAHPWLSTVSDGPAPFAVFLALVLATGLAALLAGDEPQVVRARWRVVALGGLMVMAAAKSVELLGNYALFDEFIRLDLVDGLDGAMAFAGSLTVAPLRVVGAWTGLTALVAFLGLRGTPPPGGLRSLAGPLALAALLLAVHVQTTRLQMRIASRIVPSYLAGAADQHLGFELDQTRAGLTVTEASIDGPVATGHVLMTVNRTRVTGLEDLLRRLADCRCEVDASCTLAERCLEPGDALHLELADDDGRVRSVQIPWWPEARP